MNVSYVSSSTSQSTVDNIKLQYAVESSINQALWRINAGVDSLANMSYDGVSTVWDSTAMTLTVNVDKFQMESEILLDLSEDTHFERGISAEETISNNGYDPEIDEEQQSRDGFSFLPDADLDYFLSNPDFVNNENYKHWHEDTFADGKWLITGNDLHLRNVVLNSGVLVFTGDDIDIDGITVNSGTLVFTGEDVTFRYDNNITAPPADSTGSNPAVIFTNPNQDFELYSPYANETIIGAIYCKGRVDLWNGNISGPVVGKNVYYRGHFNFMGASHRDRFQWTHGFGNRTNYDWPKQIGRWRIHKWIQKNFNFDH